MIKLFPFLFAIYWYSNGDS